MIEFTVFREYSLIYQVVSAYSFLSKKKGGVFPLIVCGNLTLLKSEIAPSIAPRDDR